MFKTFLYNIFNELGRLRRKQEFNIAGEVSQCEGGIDRRLSISPELTKHIFYGVENILTEIKAA
ncbi:MAG: hypothetical protein HQ483_17675 [Rhodospirillales bacterium]|nr:hypothetical protein [Rhodospirillales bacterium]